MRGADEKLDIRGVRIGVRDEIKWNKIRALELYFSGKLSVVPELLRTLVFARPCGGDQFAAGTVSPSLDMSR